MYDNTIHGCAEQTGGCREAHTPGNAIHRNRIMKIFAKLMKFSLAPTLNQSCTIRYYDFKKSIFQASTHGQALIRHSHVSSVSLAVAALIFASVMDLHHSKASIVSRFSEALSLAIVFFAQESTVQAQKTCKELNGQLFCHQCSSG